VYEIIVYRNNEEMCRCMTVSYLRTFFEEASSENCWVKFKGEFYSPDDFLRKFEEML